MRVVPDLGDYTEKELLCMKRVEAISGLTEQAQRFCEAYVEGHNRKIALTKAGFSAGTVDGPSSGAYAYKLLRDKKVKRYIMWLKVRIMNASMVNALDIIDEWVRIAFSDMSDFVDILPTYIKLKPSDKIDGQLIKAIKSGKDGVSIELHDKMKALDNLAKYCQDMPQDWKQKIEERRQELLEDEFELKKKAYLVENPEVENDGFIEAIKESAKSIWEQ